MAAQIGDIDNRSEVDSRWSAAALVFLAGFSLLAWPWISGAVTIPWDAKAHWLPQLQFLAGSLARGDSPFWNPYVFSGHPQIADPQSLIFSPLFVVLALFDRAPGLWAADMMTLLMLVGGGFAILVWFNDRGWHPGGGIIAALAFSFGPLAWRLQHTGQLSSAVYLAVTLVLLDRALRQSSWSYGLGAGVVGGLMVLGRDQIALIGVYLLIAYVIWYWFDGEGTRRLARSVVPLTAGTLAGAALVTLPILMTVLAVEDSNRPQITLDGAGAGSLHPALLLTWLVPDLYGATGSMDDYWGPPSFVWEGTGLFTAQNVGVLYAGAIPVLLLLWGLIGGQLFAQEIRFFTAALAVTLVFALGWYTPAFAAFYKLLPGVDLFRRPADAVPVISLLAAILAGYAMHRLLNSDLIRVPRKPWIAVGFVVAASFVTGAAIAWHFDRLDQAKEPLARSLALLAGGTLTIVLARWLQPIRPILASGLIVVFTVGDLWASNGPNTSNAMAPETYDVLEPDTDNDTIRTLKRLVAEGLSRMRRDRVELIGLGFHWPNASMTHELENTLGYNPFRLSYYDVATGAGDTSGPVDGRRLQGIMPSYNSAIADLLGLRFIAAGSEIAKVDPKLKEGDLKLVAKTGDGFIYENPRALPRVLYASEAYFDDFERWPEIAASSASLGFHLSGLKFRRSVLIHRPGAKRNWPLHPPELPGPERSVQIVSYANTDVVIEADGPGGYVVLNDIWHPWWFAEVDGAPAAIERANFLFRAVAVPPGSHTVRFMFRPVQGAFDELGARLISGTRSVER